MIVKDFVVSEFEFSFHTAEIIMCIMYLYI